MKFTRKGYGQLRRADEFGIGRVTLLKRLQRGVPFDVAVKEKGYLRWKT